MLIKELLNKSGTQPRKLDARDTPHVSLSTAFQRRAAYRHHPGATGVDPTRFGDWEYNGRCTDF